MTPVDFVAEDDVGQNAPLADFIDELRQFLPLRKLPPFEVLNMYLAEGEVDRGMSGGLWWGPFHITGDE